MKIERLHLLIGLAWLLAGMGLGDAMGRSGDHGQMPTHAHIMLLGGVLSVSWAVLYRVFALAQGLVAWIQFVLHHAGAAVMVGALYMLYGGRAEEAALGPVLGISGYLVMASVLAMIWLAAAATGAKTADAAPAAAE
ncbi:TonB-dependent receptor [Marinicauda salina]|uniref:TonB-dependent receptor n=1 Tax=Marinicauda salina TaxID=2135793 RepID=A0A2U2BRM7_9PROT|nr:TonB-dependent receptor [Marinicauda salina]PWE16664.1 TonB-dependent receptor [Marinicauda salina]